MSPILLQYLFLRIINAQLSFWVDSWNQHKLQIWGGPNRSPMDLFVFDMLVHGVWGDQLPDEEELSTEELEVYGVDWEGLRDDKLLRAWRQNNPVDEEGSSWVGWSGPPVHLNEVSVESPPGDLTQHKTSSLDNAVEGWYKFTDDNNRISLWAQGLGCARAMQGDLFWCTCQWTLTSQIIPIVLQIQCIIQRYLWVNVNVWYTTTITKDSTEDNNR